MELIRAEIAESYHELCRQRKTVTADQVKNLYLGEGEQEYTLLNLVQYHNTHFKNTLAPGTLKNYFTTHKYVIKFLKDKKRVSDLHLSELNYQFIIDFELFLRNHRPTDHRPGMENNGVMKHLERLRKMVGLALKMEWIEKEPFSHYQLKFHRVDKEFLTCEELDKIEAATFPTHRLEWTRDMFVFCCYTGLAYIDVMNLTPDHIQNGIDGELWIRTRRQKTDTAVNTPLLPEAIEILKRAKKDPRAIANGTVFPRILNQKINNYLKEIAELCGVRKSLTFHVARHTFATSVTLTNGVPIETVSKMLGHTKISTTQIYARVLEKKIGEH